MLQLTKATLRPQARGEEHVVREVVARSLSTHGTTPTTSSTAGRQSAAPADVPAPSGEPSARSTPGTSRRAAQANEVLARHPRGLIPSRRLHRPPDAVRRGAIPTRIRSTRGATRTSVQPRPSRPRQPPAKPKPKPSPTTPPRRTATPRPGPTAQQHPRPGATHLLLPRATPSGNQRPSTHGQTQPTTLRPPPPMNN